MLFRSIKIGKSLDTPLKDLITIFQSSSSDELLAFIDERERDVQLKIKELNQMVLKIQNLKASLKSSHTKGTGYQNGKNFYLTAAIL